VCTNYQINRVKVALEKTLICWVVLLLWVALLSFAVISKAQADNARQLIAVETPQDFDFGVWANAGSLSSTAIGCAAAAQEGKGGLGTKNYTVKVENLDTGNGFYLYRNGDAKSTGTSRIAIQILHADILEKSLYEVLKENTYELQKHIGQLPGCPKGKNSALRVNISSTELAGKLGGDYVGEFELWIKEGGDEFSSGGSFRVFISIGGVAQVQVSGLDNIDFGSHAGIGDLRADEAFCVFSSGAKGGYRLSLSSDQQDSAGTFYMTNVMSGQTVAMSILFAADGTGPGYIPMTDNFVSANGDSTNTDCLGKENATLSFLILEADLQAASTGSYHQLIRVLVEPE
jgi:hypothetical protein